jgi:hypothetical protein
VATSGDVPASESGLEEYSQGGLQTARGRNKRADAYAAAPHQLLSRETADGSFLGRYALSIAVGATAALYWL